MVLPRQSLLFVTLVAFCTTPTLAQEQWVSLFDGQSLAGWKAAENPGSPRVEDGAIVCEGKRAHLFYVGPDGQAEFENFELELEVKTEPGANSGVYFLTKWQDSGWPDAGFEAQVNNRQSTFKEQDYRENKKTGSLYGLRNLYKPLAQDGEWFTMNVKVSRPRVEIRLNGRLVSDYIEPANPVLPAPGPKLNLLGKGTFALQCHDEASRARFRNIRVRRLPPGEDASVAKPVLSKQDLRRLALGKDNFPLVNLRVRLERELTLAKVEELRHRTGIFPGIVSDLTDFHHQDPKAVLFTLEKAPVFVGLDLNPKELGVMKDFFAEETIKRFDYILGKPIAEALSEPVESGNEQGIMNREVDELVRLIETTPIDVYAGVMLMRTGFRSSADILWTDERMQRVIAAAAKHGVAFEIDLRKRTPSEKFIKMAKAAKVKFTAGSDTTTMENFTDWTYFLEMQQAAGLGWRDMWVPGHGPTRAQREMKKP